MYDIDIYVIYMIIIMAMMTMMMMMVMMMMVMMMMMIYLIVKRTIGTLPCPSKYRYVLASRFRKSVERTSCQK